MSFTISEKPNSDVITITWEPEPEPAQQKMHSTLYDEIVATCKKHQFGVCESKRGAFGYDAIVMFRYHKDTSELKAVCKKYGWRTIIRHA
jgi:hypothetical protein